MSEPILARDARVYPRVCGGANNPSSGAVAVEGLSPRVRGSQGPRVERAVGGGSIPACAGEPWAHAWKKNGSGVYPRVCGGAP